MKSSSSYFLFSTMKAFNWSKQLIVRALLVSHVCNGLSSCGRSASLDVLYETLQQHEIHRKRQKIHQQRIKDASLQVIPRSIGQMDYPYSLGASKPPKDICIQFLEDEKGYFAEISPSIGEVKRLPIYFEKNFNMRLFLHNDLAWQRAHIHFYPAYFNLKEPGFIYIGESLSPTRNFSTKEGYKICFTCASNNLLEAIVTYNRSSEFFRLPVYFSSDYSLSILSALSLNNRKDAIKILAIRDHKLDEQVVYIGDSSLIKNAHEVDKLFPEEKMNSMTYTLQQEDIAHIGALKYGFFGDHFEIIGCMNQLNNCIKRYVASLTSGIPLTLIVNLNHNHWVALVIFYYHNRLTAYYGDSLVTHRNEMNHSVRAHSSLLSFSNIRRSLNNYHIDFIDLSLHVQQDRTSCGIYALEYARMINQKVIKAASGASKHALRAIIAKHMQGIHVAKMRKNYACYLEGVEVGTDLNHDTPTTSKEPSYFSKMPPELMHKVLQYLPIQDRLNFLRVDQKTRQVFMRSLAIDQNRLVNYLESCEIQSASALESFIYFLETHNIPVTFIRICLENINPTKFDQEIKDVFHILGKSNKDRYRFHMGVHNIMKDKECVTFAKLLSDNRSVRTIDLSHNLISSKGLRELCCNLAKTSVEKIDLTNNLIYLNTDDYMDLRTILVANNLHVDGISPFEHESAFRRVIIHFDDNFNATTLASSLPLKDDELYSMQGSDRKLGHHTQESELGDNHRFPWYAEPCPASSSHRTTPDLGNRFPWNNSSSVLSYGYWLSMCKKRFPLFSRSRKNEINRILDVHVIERNVALDRIEASLNDALQKGEKEGWPKIS